MPLELNPLRMAVDEWLDAEDGDAKDRAAERFREIARPGLIHILLAAYDDAMNIAQRLRDRYGDEPDA